MPLWPSKRLVAAIGEFIAAGEPGPVATVDAPHLLRAVQRERDAVGVWQDDSHGMAAVVAQNFGRGADWEARARKWRGSMLDGGLLISIDKGGAAEVSRRLICSGFSGISQVRIGRRLVTCGHLVSVPS